MAFSFIEEANRGVHGKVCLLWLRFWQPLLIREGINRPDGSTMAFHCSSWGIVQEDMMNFLRYFHEFGTLER